MYVSCISCVIFTRDGLDEAQSSGDSKKLKAAIAEAQKARPKKGSIARAQEGINSKGNVIDT